MQSFIFLQKCHPASHGTNKITNTKSDKQIDNKKSKSSKSVKFTITIKAESITHILNYQIKTKKSFTTLNTRIEEIDNEGYDLTI